MAIFIPDSRPEDFNGSYGEMAAYDSLRKLSDDYTVFYSLSWVGSRDKSTVGEADFVVAHPSKGILVIEVKNGDIEYRNGEWLQINSKSHKAKRIDPFVQARKSQFEIMDRLNQGIRDFKLPMLCYAVWFTSVVIEERELLPMESPNEITLDQLDLSHPQESIDAVFDYWERKYKKTSLEEGQYQKVIEQLCPHFHVVSKWGAEGTDGSKAYIQLTRYQHTLLRFLEEQRTAVINGMAGTGKSVLAVECAGRLAESEERVLFLCCSSKLKNVLSEKAAKKGVDYRTAEELDSSREYNHIVIDEAHRMDDELLNSLYEGVEKNKGHFYVFYNSEKYESDKKLPMWIEDSECRLVLKHKFI